MKAACVLVCLTLAQGITGNIIKHQVGKVDGLEVQELENINQYQQQQLGDQLEDQKQWDQTLQNQKYHKQPRKNTQRDQKLQDQKYHNQPSEEQQYQNQEQQSQESVEKYHKQTLKSKQRDQQLQGQKYYNQQSEEQQYQDQEQQSQESKQSNQNTEFQHPSFNPQEQYSAYNHPIHLHPNHHHHHHDHHEKTHHHSSSSSSSQESKEKKHYDNQEVNLSDENQKWISPLYSSVINKKNQHAEAYGDATLWKNLQMAVGPNAAIRDQQDIEKIFGDAQKAMKHIQEEDKSKFHDAYEIIKKQDQEIVILNATQLSQKDQYPVEEHTVKTDDGYILTLFRILPKKETRDVQKRPVVFLMHDIMGSADDWLLMGSGKSLAYLLSDAGYDVWLGNARGNKYSSRHVTKSPALADFWQITVDDMANHDLPAMMDYALESSKQEKLFYIGHGLGTTMFFALTASRPEYNNKIVMMYALSPMVYMTNVRSPLLRMIAPTSKFHERLQRLFGNGAFNPSKELVKTVGGAMCENELGCKKVCSNLNFVMAGLNVDGMDLNLIPVLMNHLPAGTSTKVIKQYGQGVSSHEFRKYDYGPYINEQVYGKQEPPKYNIAEVQAPVTLYYSEEDWLAHPKDVERLQEELPNVKETNKVPEEHFSHMDFQFSTKAPELVYKKLIQSMENAQ